jgi:hypothetical protein
MIRSKTSAKPAASTMSITIIRLVDQPRFPRAGASLLGVGREVCFPVEPAVTDGHNLWNPKLFTVGFL